jgi:hypothetical protein
MHQAIELCVLRNQLWMRALGRVPFVPPPSGCCLFQRIKDSRACQGDETAGVYVEQEHVRVGATRASTAAGVPALCEDSEPGAVVVAHRPDLAGDRAVRAQRKPGRLR